MKYLVLILLIMSSLGYAAESKTKEGADELVGIFYFNQMFGHLHKSSTIESTSLTTLSCGFPVKVLKTNSTDSVGWELANVGEFRGYLRTEQLSDKMPDCFQSKYPKFFNGLTLDIAEIWFWGRLYDQYIMVKAKVQ